MTYNFLFLHISKNTNHEPYCQATDRSHRKYTITRTDRHFPKIWRLRPNRSQTGIFQSRRQHKRPHGTIDDRRCRGARYIVARGNYHRTNKRKHRSRYSLDSPGKRVQNDSHHARNNEPRTTTIATGCGSGIGAYRRK